MLPCSSFDRQDNDLDSQYIEQDPGYEPEHPFVVEENCNDDPASLAIQTSRLRQIQSKGDSKRLQLTLIEYIWNQFGDEEE